MARYSGRHQRWFGRERSNPPQPESDRDNREWRTELPGGIVRIDMGEPVKRLACEPQPVAVRNRSATSTEPAVLPADPQPLAAMLPKDLRPRDWRDDYGVAKLGH